MKKENKNKSSNLISFKKPKNSKELYKSENKNLSNKFNNSKFNMQDIKFIRKSKFELFIRPNYL